MEHPRTETPTKEALLKTITFAVPCYNSTAYMDHCVETLLDVFEDKAHKRICTFVCSCKAKRTADLFAFR